MQSHAMQSMRSLLLLAIGRCRQGSSGCRTALGGSSSATAGWPWLSCHPLPACAATLSSNAAVEREEDDAGPPFDAATASAPAVVHELVGDPRTGIADDSTTAPWGPEVSIEWVWSSPDTGVDWYRYSMAGSAQLPHMYMDVRLSDHSRNLMYLLRCKDPQRWSIPALADKFRIRRQRVMAILALKEIQAHRMEQGMDMGGPMAPYMFRVPLCDVHVTPDGEPVDLAQLVRQQQGAAALTAGSSGGSEAVASSSLDGGAMSPPERSCADDLGSLEDFLAPEAGGSNSSGAAKQQHTEDALSGLSAASAGQAADLGMLLPQLGVTTQQLQLQLLQLLQQHHFSTVELERRLMEQLDAAEAYYMAHVAGTPLEDLLLGNSEADGFAEQQQQQQQQHSDSSGESTAEATNDGAEEAALSAALSKRRPAWLDFDGQRAAVRQLLDALTPLLERAGPEHDRAAGRLLAALQPALAAADAAVAAGADSIGDGTAETAAADSPAVAALRQLVEQQGGASPAALAAAFNLLELPARQRLVALAPQMRVLLNVQGADLRAVLTDGAARVAGGPSTRDSGAPKVSQGVGAEPPGQWPGAVPMPVDVWGYEELPGPALDALAAVLRSTDAFAAATAAAGAAGPSGASAAPIDPADGGADALDMLARGAALYSGIGLAYDAVLAAQAVAAADPQQRGSPAAAATDALKDGMAVSSPPPLPPDAQRRYMRLLRELDIHALDKLLLWESYFKEEAAARGNAAGASGRRNRTAAAAAARLRRFKARVHASLQALDASAAAAGQPGPYEGFPDLPLDTPKSKRVEKDAAAARLDALVVGRVFHRGSGDRNFVRPRSYPKFEGRSLEDFDHIQEGELSAVARLAAERQDNMMWKEFHAQLLHNIGLTAPDMLSELARARPPRPDAGWSYVVHPIGGAARAHLRRQQRATAQQQWLPDDAPRIGAEAASGAVGGVPDFNPAHASPLEPYVATPSYGVRALNEEESTLADTRVPKPRRRWYASFRGRLR